LTNKKDDVVKESEAKVKETEEAIEAEATDATTEEAEETVVEDEATEDQVTEENQSDPLKDAEKEIEVLKAANVRMQAEFQNFKKRVEKEKADIYKFANEKLVIELLGVMDNVERAIGSMDTSESNKNVVDGVQMIQKTLEDFLKKHQVEVIEAVGTPFDPQKHHAVMTEASEDHPSETVIEEFQRGYELNGKVVRPSMVKVSE
jgi:molecular chaperone GrpE